MTTVSISQMQRYLRRYYDHRSTHACMMIGQPGIGKTQIVEELAREKGVKLEVFLLNSCQRTEVSGLRMPDNEHKKLVTFDDARMEGLKDGDILYFDEFYTAAKEVWTATMTLVCSRIMASGKKLNDIFIVAASNAVKSPVTIPPEIRNRFDTFELHLDLHDVEVYFKKKYRITLSKVIKSTLQPDSTTWNVFTPRTLEKLVQMCMSFHDCEKQDWEEMCGVLFGITLADEIWKCCRNAEVAAVSRDEAFEAIKNIAYDKNDLGLYKAALDKDWKAVSKAIQNDPDLIEALKSVSANDIKEGNLNVPIEY